jgi:hypothetical protein
MGKKSPNKSAVFATREEVADLIGRTPRTVDRLTADGGPLVKLDGARITRESLDAYLKSIGHKASPSANPSTQPSGQTASDQYHVLIIDADGLSPADVMPILKAAADRVGLVGAIASADDGELSLIWPMTNEAGPDEVVRRFEALVGMRVKASRNTAKLTGFERRRG